MQGSGLGLGGHDGEQLQPTASPQGTAPGAVERVWICCPEAGRKSRTGQAGAGARRRRLVLEEQGGIRQVKLWGRIQTLPVPISIQPGQAMGDSQKHPQHLRGEERGQWGRC